MANNRGIKGGQRVMTANDPSTPAPLFNFYRYEVGKKYYNNQQQVDFVTYDGNLYVCTSFDGVTTTEPNPDRNEGFLLIVKKGEDGQQGVMGLPGVDGSTPEIRVKFEGKRLVIYDATTQTRLTSSPELVGPTWKPVQQDNKITWRLDDGTSTPAAIDLDELRPKEEHPILLRLDSDNTKRSDEEGGPGYYIQWKREGNQEWTDLMSISELMNIALAGVTFWMADDEHGATDSNGQPIQRLHVGHKQVVRATYDASKLGNRRIADVELGEVLFDAGEIPFPDFTEDINALNTFLCDLQGDLEVLRELIPLDYVKTVNGHLPVNGDVQLTEYYDKETSDGRYLRSVKQLNGQSLAGTGGLWIKTVNNQPLLTNDPAGGNVKVVGSIQIGNGALIEPDTDGIAHLPAYSSSDPTGGLTREEADDLYQPKGNYLKGVKVNGTTYNNPNSSGIVDLGSIGGGTSPVDTSDCIKAITINNERKTPENGEVSFTISVGGTSLFDVRLHQDRYLQKTTDGEHWETLLDINTIGGDPSTPSTGGLTEAQVKTLIGKILEGVLDEAIPEYVRTTGHNYFVRINELNSRLSDYYTKSDIDTMLAGYDPSDPGTITIVSYRTFTIYTWYSVDATPATPILPTSASWDGTSNGLTLVGNTNNWSDHPGNRPNDSTRLWMATITLKSDGTSSNDWSGPIDLTAYPGKDGNGIEFIYTLCANETEFNALTTPAAQYQDDRDDDYPSGWTDQPQSIGRYTAADEIATHHTFTGNEEVLFRIEAASIRTSTNGHWSTYCKPFIWSMWGEDGLDGDGVEYIFFLTDGTNGVVTESNGEYSLNQNNWPDNSWAYEYQAPNSGWKDNPTGVDSTNKYEFVSKRKYHVNSETRQGAWSNWSEPALWSIYKEGPVGPIGPDGISIISQVRYYKASDQSTGVTAPNIDADPTTAANGGWSTSSNMLQLDAEHPYLWFFERTVYSNGTVYQSVPVIIRYLNSAVQVDYSEIEANVLEAIGDDLDALDDRLSVIVDTNGAIIPDGQNGLISVITNYVDNNQKSFADLIVDAKEADIKAWAGSEVADELGRPTLTTVKNELDGIDGKITTAATQARQAAVSDARTEWSAADATITSTVTNAKYVWVKNANNTNPNDPEVVAYNGETTKSGYTKTLIADEMSALKQTSDAVSIIVGQDGQVSADLIISTINGGTAQIDANHIVLNGETIATAIQAAEISADQITSGTLNSNRIAANSIDATKINAANLQVAAANITGQLTASQINTTGLVATAASFDYLTVGGQPISANNSLNIVFGNSSTISNPQPNTIYFIYNT